MKSILKIAITEKWFTYEIGEPNPLLIRRIQNAVSKNSEIQSMDHTV